RLAGNHLARPRHPSSLRTICDLRPVQNCDVRTGAADVSDWHGPDADWSRRLLCSRAALAFIRVGPLRARARIPTGSNRPARESEHRMIRRMRQNGAAVQMTAYYLKKVEDLRMHELLTCLLRDETGVAGVEYGILIAAVVAALIVATSSVGGQIVANAFSLLSSMVRIACTSSCGNG